MWSTGNWSGIWTLKPYRHIPLNYIGVVTIVDQIVEASVCGQHNLPIWDFLQAEPFVRLSNFRDMVARETETTIDIRRPSKNADSGLASLPAFTVIDGDKHIIGISRLCNRCWFRFAATKELFHVLRPVEEDGRGFDEVIEDANTQMQHRHDLVSDISNEVDIEVFCYFAAIELLIPHSIREDLEDYRNEGYLYFDLARALRCPEYLLKNEVFSKSTGLRETSEEAWRALEKQKKKSCRA